MQATKANPWELSRLRKHEMDNFLVFPAPMELIWVALMYELMFNKTAG